MFNFVKIVVHSPKKGKVLIEPKFDVGIEDSDLMIRGGDLYAVFNSDTNLWVENNEKYVIKTIDAEIMNVYNNLEKNPDVDYIPLLMRDSDSGQIDKWHKYGQTRMPLIQDKEKLHVGMNLRTRYILRKNLTRSCGHMDLYLQVTQRRTLNS